MGSKRTQTCALARIACVAGALALAAFQASAQVSWENLSLTFIQPTGTVGPNDSIDVWLRFANNDASEPFTVDNSLPDGGLNPSNLPIWGQYWNGSEYVYKEFASYTSFWLATGFGCSGTFTSSCTSGPPYSFAFGSNPFGEPYTLAAGEHHDYLFGTFTPSSGPAAPGDYYFYRSVVWLNVYGLDDAGNELSATVFPTQTCTGDSLAACEGQSYFTRTVVAVPEPGGWAMMLIGLVALGGLHARGRAPRG